MTDQRARERIAFHCGYGIDGHERQSTDTRIGRQEVVDRRIFPFRRILVEYLL